jgi:predicted short-subunit dehydrogenase-like oxidoreductase (DUF2520 family)
MRLGIIGGGRAAWAFGSSWRAAALPLAGIALRSGSASPAARLLAVEVTPLEDLIEDSDIVIVAVSDRAIPEVAAQLSGLRPQQPLFHCSGSLPGAVLGNRSNAFSLHPFRALPAVGEPVTLQGTLMVYEGPDSAVADGRRVAGFCGGQFGRVTAEAKPRYHAAAVFAANYVAAMLQMSEEILLSVELELSEPGGPDPSTTLRRAIVDLASSASSNWLHQRGAAAFTGPAARGERQVVAGHLAALGDLPHARQIYRQLAAEVLRRTVGPAADDGDDALAKWLADSTFLP